MAFGRGGPIAMHRAGSPNGNDWRRVLGRIISASSGVCKVGREQVLPYADTCGPRIASLPQRLWVNGCTNSLQKIEDNATTAVHEGVQSLVEYRDAVRRDLGMDAG